jgi:hypothetical protein
MAGQTSDELLALFDTAPLNARCWAIFAIMSAIIVLEFFDFGVVAFLLAVVGPAWHLTYGQSATILYSGGVGSFIGALAFGAFSDAWGARRRSLSAPSSAGQMRSNLVAARLNGTENHPQKPRNLGECRLRRNQTLRYRRFVFDR